MRAAISGTSVSDATNALSNALLAYDEYGRARETPEQPTPPSEPPDLNSYAAECHEASLKWWYSARGDKLKRNRGELLMLIVSEIAEAMEGERKDTMDDKLPHRKMAEVELADALIRIFDYAGAYGYDLQGAYEEKMQFNATREDHTHEARAKAGGKRF